MAAAALLKKDIPDLTLVFVGSQKNGYASTRELSATPRVIRASSFLGYVPDGDMPEFYRRARALRLSPRFSARQIYPPWRPWLWDVRSLYSVFMVCPSSSEMRAFFDPASVKEISHIMQALWRGDDFAETSPRKGTLPSSQWTQAHFNKRFRVSIEHILKIGSHTHHDAIHRFAPGVQCENRIFSAERRPQGRDFFTRPYGRFFHLPAPGTERA